MTVDEVSAARPLSAVRVAFAEAHKLEWLLLKDTPGFHGTDLPGVEVKFFGQPDKGPWFYLFKHEPGTFIPRHRHTGDVFHYIMEGEWHFGQRENRIFGEGFMQFEQEGLYYGPFRSGPEGSLFLAIYNAEPSFIEPEDEHAAQDATPTYE